MIDRIGKGLLVLILTAGVLLGAYLGITRYYVEQQDKTVELCVDLNDLKLLSAAANKSLGELLGELKTLQVSSLGVAEQTLADASAMGDLYFISGSGFYRLGENLPSLNALEAKGLISPTKTYIVAPNEQVRGRVIMSLTAALGRDSVRLVDPKVVEVDLQPDSLAGIGIGISETQRKYLTDQGFRIVPRVWQDQHYNSINLPAKIDLLAGYDTIVFDGEEILGYPENLAMLANSLKKNNIRFGFVEIVNQLGNEQLKKLMDNNMVRVHGISRDELKKVPKEEAISRIIRGVKERKIRLVYIRPYLPPVAGSDPLGYNLDYLKQVKDGLQAQGFVLGEATNSNTLSLQRWQVALLGASVIVTTISLAEKFLPIPMLVSYLILILSVSGILFGGHQILMQKLFALLTVITFPTWAVVSTFSRSKKVIYTLWGATMVVFNIIAETMIGVILLVGLLTDYRFMQGIELFAGIKLALVLPILLVALFFILDEGNGTLKQKVNTLLNTQIKLGAIVIGLGALGLLGIFVARSGNFIIPVPGIEKAFRSFLETALAVRPRTKEFLIGYPFLFYAATYFLRGRRRSLWAFAAIGVIAPISIINSFCHAHTPLAISLTRTLNGLVLGALVGMFISLAGAIFIKE